jgi:hypothetical protein
MRPNDNEPSPGMQPALAPASSTHLTSVSDFSGGGFDALGLDAGGRRPRARYAASTYSAMMTRAGNEPLAIGQRLYILTRKIVLFY